MARDNRRTRSPSPRPASGWAWLLAGFLLGVGASFVVYMKGQPALQRFAGVSLPPPGEAPGAPQGGGRGGGHDSSRRFDFYTLLPEVEVSVPQEPDAPRATAPRETPPAPPVKTREATVKGAYILQAGSFQKYKEADTLKARLAMMGVEARIQNVRVGKNTFHRVRVGPFRNFTEAEKVQAKLRRSKVDSLLLKIGG